MRFSCRFYRQKFPEIDDLVMVNVKRIADMGAYVQLLEYNNIEGMILMSELSRRRIRSVNKLIKVGRHECVMVFRVDAEKGYIDLSKRRVTAEEVPRCEEKFAKAKTVNQILRHTAEVLNYETSEQLEQLTEKTAWYFDDKYGRPAASYDAFKLAVGNPAVLDECSLDTETKEVLLENIKRRLTPQPVKIRSDIEVACYTYEGVDAVKAALKKGLELSTEELPVKINLIAPPLYVCTLSTLDRIVGLQRLQEVIDAVAKCIRDSDGIFNVQMAPKVVSDTEEALLAEQLHSLEIASREVDGDDDAEEGMGELSGEMELSGGNVTADRENGFDDDG